MPVNTIFCTDGYNQYDMQGTYSIMGFKRFEKSKQVFWAIIPIPSHSMLHSTDSKGMYRSFDFIDIL